MKIDRIFDYMLEELSADYEYAKLSARYRKKHGCGAFFYNGKRLTDEEQRLDYARRNADEAHYIRWAIQDVLGLEGDQLARLYNATRALRRWYNDTEWMVLPSEELLTRLYRYIIGEEI